MLSLVRSRLAFRLAALFLLATLTPILGAAILLPRVFEESTRRELARRHQLLAERTATLLEEYVDRAQEKLRTVARIWGEGGFPLERDADALTQRLNALVEPPDVFLELVFYPADRTPEHVVQSRQNAFDAAQRVMPDHDLRNFQNIVSNAEKPLVREPLEEGREYRSDRLDVGQGFITLTLSVPVLSGGRVLGALAAYIDLVRFWPLVEALEGESYDIQVRDKEGVTLLPAYAQSSEDQITHDWTSPSGWRFRVHEPARALKATLSDFQRKTWLWVGVAAAVAIAASLGLSTWLTRPIGELERAARALEGGDFAARTGIERADELGRLGATFDRMSSALGELDRVKSEFVANVSHELRTPLTSMQLSLANLLDGVVGEVPERQRAALTRVQTELERLIRLVNQLLEMARLDAGAVEVKREGVDLLPLAARVVDSLRPLAAERDVQVLVAGSGTVLADAAMLHRVLVNLLDNALKFSPEGGMVRLTLSPTGFRVEDQGPGLDPELAFASFRQGEQHGVKNPGVGLGLAIVKRLVDLNGGTIRVEEGPGGSVVVTLPEARVL